MTGEGARLRENEAIGEKGWFCFGVREKERERWVKEELERGNEASR